VGVTICCVWPGSFFLSISLFFRVLFAVSLFPYFFTAVSLLLGAVFFYIPLSLSLRPFVVPGLFLFCRGGLSSLLPYPAPPPFFFAFSFAVPVFPHSSHFSPIFAFGESCTSSCFRGMRVCMWCVCVCVCVSLPFSPFGSSPASLVFSEFLFTFF
jgi:hypothetical protein